MRMRKILFLTGLLFFSLFINLYSATQVFQNSIKVNGNIQSTGTITAGGNVGIGTTTPSTKLHLYGTTNSLLGPHIQAVTSADIYPVFQQVNWGHDNIALSFDSYFTGSNWSSSDVGSNFQIYKMGDLLRFNYESGIAAGLATTFKTGMVLTNTGNVGIGTTNPTAKLSFGAVNGLKFALFENAGGANMYGFGYGNGTSSTDIYANGSIGMSVRSSGVGIGTTTPALRLDVYGVAGAPAVSGTAQTGTSRFQSAEANVLDFGNYNTSPYGVWLQSTNRANLALQYPIILNPNGGNVGIGTTNPTEKLEVVGNLKLNNPATDGQLLLYDITASTTVLINSNGTSYFNGGNLQIGKKIQYTPSATQVLYSTDTITADTSYSLIVSSGGVVALTSNPQIASGDYIGQDLEVCGTSNTNTITLTDGNGLDLDSAATTFNMGLNDNIGLRWNGNVWYERYRNNN